jgi:ABC-type phosphate transport system substrate-binding protein
LGRNICTILDHYLPENDDYHGSNTGIDMLLKNKLTFSLSSEILSSLPANNEASIKNIPLGEYKVASDAVVFYVKKNLQVANAGKNWHPSVDLSQLGGILRGDIKSWPVGGINLPIKVYTRNPKNSGTAKFVQRNVMNNKPFFVEKKVGYMKTTTQSIRAVANPRQPNEVRIGYASASEVCNEETVQVLLINKIDPCEHKIKQETKTNNVNIPVLEYYGGAYPAALKRFLYVIIRKDIPLSKQAGVGYCNILLSDDGKKILKKEGIIPLK